MHAKKHQDLFHPNDQIIRDSWPKGTKSTKECGRSEAPDLLSKHTKLPAENYRNTYELECLNGRK